MCSLCDPPIPLHELEALLRHVSTTKDRPRESEEKFRKVFAYITDHVTGTAWEYVEALEQQHKNSKSGVQRQCFMHSVKDGCVHCRSKAFRCKHVEAGSPDGSQVCGERLVRSSVTPELKSKEHANKPTQFALCFATCERKVSQNDKGQWSGHYQTQWPTVMGCILDHIEIIKMDASRQDPNPEAPGKAVIAYLNSHAKLVSLAVRFHILRAVWFHATKILKYEPTKKPVAVTKQPQRTVGLIGILATENARRLTESEQRPESSSAGENKKRQRPKEPAQGWVQEQLPWAQIPKAQRGEPGKGGKGKGKGGKGGKDPKGGKGKGKGKGGKKGW